MKISQRYPGILLLLSILLATTGCDNSSANAEKAKRQQDSLLAIHVADSLRVVALEDSLTAMNREIEKKLEDSTLASDFVEATVIPETKKEPTPVVTDPASTARLDKCYLKVSFISIGSGIDAKAEKQFMTEIASFEKSEGVKLTYDRKNWGREGERDYCFSSLGLTDAQREAWSKRIHKVFKGNDLVQIPK